MYTSIIYVSILIYMHSPLYKIFAYVKLLMYIHRGEKDRKTLAETDRQTDTPYPPPPHTGS